MAEPDVVVCSPRAECAECGHRLHKDRTVQASVLFPVGWWPAQHIALRCRYRQCTLENKRVVYNFISFSRNEYRCDWIGDEMRYFFVSSQVGVSLSWLQQMTRRMVHQYATFRGEAEVHRGEARSVNLEHLVPGKSHLKLLKAWLYWRYLLRHAQYEEPGGVTEGEHTDAWCLQFCHPQNHQDGRASCCHDSNGWVHDAYSAIA